MKTKTKQWVSVLLLCISLWTLSCNWLTTTSGYEGAFPYSENTVNIILNCFGVNVDLESSVKYTETSEESSPRLSRGFSNLSEVLSDDGLSISEWRESMSFLSYVIRRTEVYGFLEDMDKDIVTTLHILYYFGYAVTVLYILTIVLVLYAILNHILKRKNFGAGATACFAIWFIFNLFAVYQLNNIAEDSVIRITGWSILALICCIASCVFWRQCYRELQMQNSANDCSLKESILQLYDKVQQVGYNRAVDSSKNTSSSAKGQIYKHTSASWECPACHSHMTAEKKFCSNCGAKRPAPVYCPKCGYCFTDNAAFCSNCGTPRPKDSDDSTDA